MPNVALITGSGKRRVGNAVAEHLAERGFDIALHYHRSEADALETRARLQAAYGIRCQAFQADLTQPGAADRLINDVYAHFGSLTALVTAHSVWTKKRFEEVDAESLRAQFDVEIAATFLCCRAAGLRMAAQPGGGSIVTIADWAIVRPYLGYSAYFAVKGALPTLTRALAVELASRNPAVRANCILPGPVLLPDEISEHERTQIREGTLVKKLGTPQHIAHAALFLIENEFVTGVSLPVDGGRTIAGGM